MTVEIVCPHCNFAKLVPEEEIPSGARYANCPRCRNRFELAFQFWKPEEATPSPGPPEKKGGGSSPWENRGELGLWQALYRTFKAVLFSPASLFRDMPTDGGLSEPLAFGLVCGSIGAMAGLFWQSVMGWETIRQLEEGFFGQLNGALVYFAIMLLAPFFAFFNMLVASVLLHVCLMIVRGGKRGFEGTFRVVAYSQATQILGFIPFVGGVAAWIWDFVVQIVGLREIHGTSYGRLAAALLIPFMLIALAAAALFVPFFLFR